MSRVKHAGAWLLCALALWLAGCATAIDAAKTGRNAVAGRISEAAAAWEKSDQAKLVAINASEKYREDAVKALQAYAQGDRAEAIKVFNTAWATVVGWDRAIQAAEAGQKKDLAVAAANAYAAIAEIVKVLTKLGVKIPAGVML